MFRKYDEKGVIVEPKKVQLDCKKAIENGERVLVEQNHKTEVDINNIIRKAAGNAELIAKTQSLSTWRFDNLPDNDFQEMMNIMVKAKDTFSQVPSHIRKQFGNDPAAFMDFVHNEDNKDQLIEWGLANKPEPAPEPVQVAVVSQPEMTTETPSA
jgi:phage internal scaffolding protein